MATIPISQRVKLRPQPHVCSLNLVCCSPLRQEWLGAKGVLPEEGASLHVPWPSVGLRTLGCVRWGQMAPLVRAQFPSVCTVCGPVRRGEPTLMGELPSGLSCSPGLCTTQDLEALFLWHPSIPSSLGAFARLLRSLLRAPYSQVIPHLHIHPSCSNLISLCDRPLPVSRGRVCPLHTQRAFQNCQINYLMDTWCEMDMD